MEERGQSEPVNSPESITSADPERTLAAPRFDDRSVHHARPAVPIQSRGGKRARPLPLAPLAVAAAMLGGGVGLAAFTYFQRHSRPVASQPRAAAQNENSAAALQLQAPPPATPQATQTRHAATEVGEPPGAATNDRGAQPTATDAGGATDKLRAALSDWIEATNARDIQRQMQFYSPRLEAYYLARDASRASVRAEKERVFARASAVEVRAEDPQIELSPDGQSATMRFRKSYSINSGDTVRRGAVIQELRWRRTPEGWRITGERDLRVLR